MKDFTPAQADQWIVQELAKHPTPDSVRARLATEEKTMQMAEKYGLLGKTPNSDRAHKELIVALRESVQ